MAAWRTKAQQPPDGRVRLSQVVTTFGPGSLVDLVDHAVLVGGLDFWSYPRDRGYVVVQEPRLRDAVVQSLHEGHPKLSVDAAFREPPAGDEQDPRKSCGIQVLQFPTWFVCQNPTCRALRKGDVLEPKGERYRHYCDDRKPTECVPVRFVVACKRGHLADFPWIWFAHEMGGRATCAAPNLRLDEGTTGDFSEISVRCTCGGAALLSKALAPTTGIHCFGHRPWLGAEGKEECDEHARLLVRTASNSYFSQTMSALSIPEPGRELLDAVERNWDVLQAATAATLPAFRTIARVQVALEKYPDNQQVLRVIEAKRDNVPAPRLPLRTAEFLQFNAQPPEVPGVLPPARVPFYARSHVPDGGLPEKISRIVLAHRLREVRVQIGFTRISPVVPNLEGEYEGGADDDAGPRYAQLGLTTKWLPATEIYGEGVFLQLDEDAVREWEDRPVVEARSVDLKDGYERWAEERGIKTPFPGARYYLLHSLSHLLISAVSLECGYAASAIRERIYCTPPNATTPMAAILLATGSPGTEGTLGGLVEQGRVIRSHLRRAFDMGVLCSNDPVCSAHSPAADHEERYLEGAACHGCLFIAECSCERFNQFLDRSLVVPTIGNPAELAFFQARP
ncbi:MAG: DrmB family protein [Planctomycetota bacterium]